MYIPHRIIVYVMKERLKAVDIMFNWSDTSDIV